MSPEGGRSAAGRAAAAVRFELSRRARAPASAVALVLYALVAAVGAWRGVEAFTGYAWTLAALPVLRFGTGGDLRHRFDACLAGPFLTPGELLLARTAGYAATAAALGVLALAGGLLVAGSPGRAAWQATEYTLLAVLAAPAILLVELVLAVRAPFAVVLLLYLAVLLVAEPLVGAEAVVRTTGLPLRPYDFGELAPLARRAAAASVVLALLAPLHRRRATAV